MNIQTCSMCGEGGHSLRSCPELRTPLKEGFQKGEGGGGGHSHDEDDTCTMYHPTFGEDDEEVGSQRLPPLSFCDEVKNIFCFLESMNQEV